MTAPPSISQPSTCVVSVSPRAAEATSPEYRSGRNTPFITPRVIDQRAFDEMSAELRSVIERAVAAGDQLAAQIALAEHAQTGTNKAAMDLQERLRLGARMLTAFQAQISRIESYMGAARNGAGSLEDQPAADAEKILAEAREEALSMIEGAGLRIAETLRNAARQLEHAGAIKPIELSGAGD